MPSYAITGVSRGLGYEFLRQYSSDSNNTVIGLVRNKAATDKKISEDADLKNRSNIHIIAADLTKYDDLKKAADETASITGGNLDYLIANAGAYNKIDAYCGVEALAEKPEEVTQELRNLFEVNVIGTVHLFNLFLPLIKKGQAKKVIALTTGYSDIEVTRRFDMAVAPLYSTSKAALNMMVAKYGAEYKKDGILFLAIAPGVVEVGQNDGATPEQIEGQREAFMKILASGYAPDFKGPITPEESIALMRPVIENVSIEKGNTGDFVSQFGNKQWL